LERTKEINAPALVIHGTEDPIIPYEHGISLAKVIPNARLLRLEGTVKLHNGSIYVITNNTDGRGKPAANDDRLLILK
jgi:hypothetical protein